MINKLKPIHWVFIGIASIGMHTAQADNVQCGERVSVDDVLVVNLEDHLEQPAVFKEKLHEQAGETMLMTEKPMQVKMLGNRAKAIDKASKSAAHNGCDLLVLLGEKEVQTRWQNRITSEVFLMVHMGKRASGTN